MAEASGTPGRHQWLQSALCPTGNLADSATLYTDGCPSLLCAVIRVTFSTYNSGAACSFFFFFGASKVGFSIPGHRCNAIFDVFSSGNVSMAHPPPLSATLLIGYISWIDICHV
nr:unnamed protein product [Digitaria exilis]